MTNALPKPVTDYLDTPAGRALLDTAAVWFRWNHRAGAIESSGAVLKSTPEQMSRPGTAVFFRIGQGVWKRYC